MSRRLLIAVLALASAALIPGALVLGQSDEREPDLVASFAIEPPTRAEAGDSFRIAFTVANEGEDGAGRSVARAYLSRGRRFDRGFVRLEGRRRVRAIGAGREHSGVMTVRVPMQTPPRFYYLVVCADDTKVVDESNDRQNCEASGQRITIGPPPDLAPGPPGPPGPRGEAGPVGEQGPAVTEFYRFGRTILPTGEANLDDQVGPAVGGDADEGSTQQSDVLTVGPLTFTALCREALPGEQQTGNTKPTNDVTKKDEAKVLVYASDGTMIHKRLGGGAGAGARVDVAAGRGTPGDDGPGGGEGQHQILWVERQQDGGMGPDASPDDASATDSAYTVGFNQAISYVAHSSGLHVLFEGFAGIDTLGSGSPENDDNGDACVFGGAVTVLTRTASR